MKKRIFFIVIFGFNFIFSQKIEIPRIFREYIDAAHLKNKEMRIDDYPLLSMESYRAHADFILDEAIFEIETDDLFDGCVIFINPRCLKDFYYKVLPFIDKKIVIVSIGGSPFPTNIGINWDNYSISDQYMPPNFATHPNILAFYAKNEIYDDPKCFPIPLGKSDL